MKLTQLLPKLLLALLPVASPAWAASGDDIVDNVVPRVMERAAVQSRQMLEALKDQPTKMPRSLSKDGKVNFVNYTDWTCGFFPGTLWLVYEYTGADEWKQAARSHTQRLASLRNFKDHHDGGFMLGSSFGNALRLAPEPGDREILLDAAKALGTRFVPKTGVISAWNSRDFRSPAIIDTMMNLELLMWAAKNGGGEKPREIALSHADRTHANHFRPDGSAYHVLDFNPNTGWLIGIHSKQGADVRTPWARGQGWAIHGFTMMHRETGKPEYLARAVTVADFVLSHPNLPADSVPYWDFAAPAGPNTPRDASSAAIIASGLIELSGVVSDRVKSETYLEAARAMIRSLATPAYLSEAGTNGGFLLTRSTGHLPHNTEINVPVAYADYYYLEALLRYRAKVLGKPRVEFSAAR